MTLDVFDTQMKTLTYLLTYLKKQNLTMEGGQKQTVCVEGKFRLTTFNACFNQRLKATSFKF